MFTEFPSKSRANQQRKCSLAPLQTPTITALNSLALPITSGSLATSILAVYVPNHFAIDGREALCKIIRSHPLGVLITMTPHGLDANHLPFELDLERQVLLAHVARANPVWQRCEDGMDVLVIFQGAEHYISPNWYPSKHELHRQVPTWNYEVVHVHGRLTVHDDERFVRDVVGRLTRTNEASEQNPWKMGDSAPEFIDSMLRSIVGIEIAIGRLEGKSKLSQNREDRDRLTAADVLSQRGETELAQAMRSAKWDSLRRS